MAEAPVSVLVVEDDEDLRDSLVEGLGLAGYRAAGAGSALAFYRALASGRFDVAVVDVGLPDENGFVLASYLRRNTDAGVIVLTARAAIEDRLVGYGAGADLYLVKPVDLRELAAAIGSLAGRRIGGAGGAPPPTPAGWRLDVTGWALVSPSGRPIALTGKEIDFLRLLAASPGAVVSRQQLTDALYGRFDEHTSRSLDSLVRRLRAKGREAGEEIPLKTAHAVGYCFSEPIKA